MKVKVEVKVEVEVEVDMASVHIGSSGDTSAILMVPTLSFDTLISPVRRPMALTCRQYATGRDSLYTLSR